MNGSATTASRIRRSGAGIASSGKLLKAGLVILAHFFSDKRGRLLSPTSGLSNQENCRLFAVDERINKHSV
jgi:hypothetical protein